MKEHIMQRWGHYCDTDKLIDDIMELLTKYHYDVTEYGVCEMLDVYFSNKSNLIDMFMKSENYIGDMRICLDTELERRSNSSEVADYCYAFSCAVGAGNAILKYVDEFGKSLQDYTRRGIGRFKARDLQYGTIREKLLENDTNRNKFNSSGITYASQNELQIFDSMMYYLGKNYMSTLTENTMHNLLTVSTDINFTVGMKTSRAFNRVCAHYKVDKLPDYNRLFARYADMVSGLKRKVKFYISLNPLDYLTMSFGNSWSSCHTIDKQTERHMPNHYQGMHAGGTMSYMLDKTSIITFVHEKEMKHYEDGKIYRNMFHYSDGTLVQGRIYPQGNDGATDLYSEFRTIMQGEMSKLIGLNENYWIKRKGFCGENTSSEGAHYADYLNFGECNVSYPREMPDAAANIVEIGRGRICVNCGEEIDHRVNTGSLTCEDCYNEEEEIEEDDHW